MTSGAPSPVRLREDRAAIRAAAVQAENAASEVVALVERVMVDGLPRTDEEIWRACVGLGFVGPLDAVERARKVFEKTGDLVQTRMKRRTYGGGLAAEWVKHWWGHCRICRRAGIEKKPGPPGVYAIIVCPTCGVISHQIVYGDGSIAGPPPEEGVFHKAVRILFEG